MDNEAASFGNVFWTIQDALNWIAFGTEPGQSPATVIADVGAGRFLFPELMGALAARVYETPRSWPAQGSVLEYPLWPQERLWPKDTPPSFPAWRCRSIIKRWMRETGLTASELLTDTETERIRYEAELKAQNGQQAALTTALDELNAAVASSRLVVLGRPSETREPPRSPTLRQPIPASHIDEPRGIDSHGNFGIQYDRDGRNCINDPGPFFYDCQIVAANVKQIWPSASIQSVTIAGERRLVTWLGERINALRNAPPGKKAMKAEAAQAGLVFSERSFARAWGVAVSAADAPRWSAAGRKSKQ